MLLNPAGRKELINTVLSKFPAYLSHVCNQDFPRGLSLLWTPVAAPPFGQVLTVSVSQVLASGIDHHLQCPSVRCSLLKNQRCKRGTCHPPSLHAPMHTRHQPFKSERFEGEPSHRHEWEPELQYMLYNNPYQPPSPRVKLFVWILLELFSL